MNLSNILMYFGETEVMRALSQDLLQLRVPVNNTADERARNP